MTDRNKKPDERTSDVQTSRPLKTESTRRKLLKITGINIAGTAGITHATGRATSTNGDNQNQTATTVIEDWHDLNAIREDLDGKYVLGTDLNANTPGYREHVSDPDGGWSPIGEFDDQEVVEFTGTFDGDGHEIANLEIDRPNENAVGLFSGIDGATVENVRLVDATVTGEVAVGGLIGVNLGVVIESWASGDVMGDRVVGGLVGFNLIGDVRESCALADVTGEEIVGGLVGENLDADVRRSWTSGTATGNFQIGGLAGKNSGKVVESWASTDVVGEEEVGGLVGQNNREVTDSYWDREATGQSDDIGDGEGSDNVTGLTTTEMQGETAVESMAALDFDETWQVVTDPDNYPRLQWQQRGLEHGPDDGPDDPDNEANNPLEIPRFGLLAAISGLGGAAYLLRRRLTGDSQTDD